jgi:hypothetical protein
VTALAIRQLAACGFLRSRPGTPAHASAVSSWHGVMHMAYGSTAFIALIAACFVLARRFSPSGQRRSAMTFVIERRAGL